MVIPSVGVVKRGGRQASRETRRRSHSWFCSPVWHLLLSPLPLTASMRRLILLGVRKEGKLLFVQITSGLAEIQACLKNEKKKFKHALTNFSVSIRKLEKFTFGLYLKVIIAKITIRINRLFL